MNTGPARGTLCLLLGLLTVVELRGGAPLDLSVYATAGDVLECLATPAGRERIWPILTNLPVSRLFLEGRRGDERVLADRLVEVRDFLRRRGLEVAGGIATVPGTGFGARQQGGLDWLNWESDRTRADIAAFFAESAPVFDELIVDDFFCTGDTSPAAERARGDRAWSPYRRDLLVSLIDPLMVGPARAAHPSIRLVVKFPQWYDRFHLFGYDPPRMAAAFDRVWVGTETRNPQTRRMGFVQPTQGYINFRWLKSVAGDKVVGAWFDHVDSTPQNFIDQAYQSVLAGARELTLFHLGDLVAGHEGDALLARQWPDLLQLARQTAGRRPAGIAAYKPPGSDAEENLYVLDYLQMLGLPILPVATYPAEAAVVFLPVQAAADPDLLPQMEAQLRRGVTLVLTPALVRRLGAAAREWSGVEVGAQARPTTATQARLRGRSIALAAPLEFDAAVATKEAAVLCAVQTPTGEVPWLTRHQPTGSRGQVYLLNVRTFAERDFAEADECLLAPKPLGLVALPLALADALRAELLRPLGVQLEGPAGIELVLFEDGCCLYSFLPAAASVRLDRSRVDLAPHAWVWRQRPPR